MSCTKSPFATRAQAEAALHRSHVKRRGDVYWCGACRSFHIGSSLGGRGFTERHRRAKRDLHEADAA